MDPETEALILLAYHLDILPLWPKPPCHSYACGCVCEACMERVKLVSEPMTPARQPWETP